jgi:predicted RNase H-like HicB family nuclease
MPSPVRFSEVHELLQEAGYELVRISGSHHIFPRRDATRFPFPFTRTWSNTAMSAESKKSSKPKAASPKRTKTRLAVKRGAFSPDHWKQAQKITAEYQIILSTEDGQWYGRGLELPHVFGDGATAEDCVESTREALASTVAYLLDVGKTPPTPAHQGLRTQQVNIRLTAEEKALLESRAHSRGFSGLSDFIRAVVIEAAY